MVHHLGMADNPSGLQEMDDASGSGRGVVCPKCGYVRRPEDTAPAYECPACGVVYAKARRVAAPLAVEAVSAPAGGRSRGLVLLLCAVGVLGVVAVGYRGWLEYEHRKVAASLETLNGFLVRLNDGLRIASSTGRIALAGPVKDLQTINREIRAFEPYGCADKPHAALASAASGFVDGFLEFMGNDKSTGELMVTVHMNSAKEAMDRFRVSRRECEARIGAESPAQK